MNYSKSQGPARITVRGLCLYGFLLLDIYLTMLLLIRVTDIRTGIRTGGFDEIGGHCLREFSKDNRPVAFGRFRQDCQ